MAGRFEGKQPEEMQYLIKYKNLSYRRCRWVNESEFFEVLSF